MAHAAPLRRHFLPPLVLLAMNLAAGEGEGAAGRPPSELLNNYANLTVDVWHDQWVECPGYDPEVHQLVWVTPDQRLLAPDLADPPRLDAPGPGAVPPAASFAVSDNSSALPVVSDSSCMPTDQLPTVEAGGHLAVARNGSLLVQDFGWRDRGRYRCLLRERDRGDGGGDGGEDDFRQAGHLDVGLQVEYREHIYYFSLMYGGIAAAGMLILTLLGKLIYWLLET